MKPQLKCNKEEKKTQEENLILDNRDTFFLTQFLLHHNIPFGHKRFDKAYFKLCQIYLVKFMQKRKNNPWNKKDIEKALKKLGIKNVSKKHIKITNYLLKEFFKKRNPCYKKVQTISKDIETKRENVIRMMNKLEKNKVILRFYIYRKNRLKGVSKNLVILPVTPNVKIPEENENNKMLLCEIECDKMELGEIINIIGNLSL